MTPQAQRIAIAGACGWRRCRKNKYGDLIGSPNGEALDYWAPIPDYEEDLNAMHEAERVMWGELGTSDYDPVIRREYYRTLDAITGDQWETITATAAQRAEAFLKTKGLWHE